MFKLKEKKCSLYLIISFLIYFIFSSQFNKKIILNRFLNVITGIFCCNLKFI